MRIAAYKGRVIDYRDLTSGDAAVCDAAIRAVAGGMQEHGFVLMENLPYDDDGSSERAAGHGGALLRLPKEKTRHLVPQGGCSYNRPGLHPEFSERQRDGSVGGTRRFFCALKPQPVGYPWFPGHYAVSDYWPTEELAPGFRASFTQMTAHCDAAALVVMQALSVAMGRPPSFFAACLRNNVSDARVNLFMPQDDWLRLMPHRDNALLTFITQAGAGFQICDEVEGRWKAVSPGPSRTIVLAGTVLELASAGAIRARAHRVWADTMPNPEDPRPSINVAIYPNPVEPLPYFGDAGESALLKELPELRKASSGAEAQFILWKRDTSEILHPSHRLPEIGEPLSL